MELLACLIFPIAILGIIVTINFRCPKCNRYFARKKINMNANKGGGLLSNPTWVKTNECVFCGHTWEEKWWEGY